MDEITEYNRERWNLPVKADAVFTRPQLDLDEKSASELANPGGVFPEIVGKDVLYLALRFWARLSRMFLKNDAEFI